MITYDSYLKGNASTIATKPTNKLDGNRSLSLTGQP